MRAFSLLAVLLLAPAVGAQTPDSTAAPRLVLQAESPRRHGQTVAAASLGALGGFAAGGLAGIVLSPPSLSLGGYSGMGFTMASASAGMALGAAAMASRDRKRPFLRALAGAAVGEAVGYGFGVLLEQTTSSNFGYAAMPAGAVAGSVWATR